MDFSEPAANLYIGVRYGRNPKENDVDHNGTQYPKVSFWIPLLLIYTLALEIIEYEINGTIHTRFQKRFK